MLNLPQKTINQIRKLLLRQQRQVNTQIKTIKEEDPVMMQAVEESPESGTVSWQAEVHSKISAVTRDLMDLSKKIAHSLSRLKRGTYGKCESCGKEIEKERLEAMPIATLCLDCSQKGTSFKKRKK